MGLKIAPPTGRRPLWRPPVANAFLGSEVLFVLTLCFFVRWTRSGAWAWIPSTVIDEEWSNGSGEGMSEERRWWFPLSALAMLWGALKLWAFAAMRMMHKLTNSRSR